MKQTLESSFSAVSKPIFQANTSTQSSLFSEIYSIHTPLLRFATQTFKISEHHLSITPVFILQNASESRILHLFY